MSVFRRVRASHGVVLALVLALGGERSAWAQGGAGDKAAAETLFNEGRTLLAQNKLDEACPKLEESLRLDTGIGTMLYLAECYERSGKTASAWAQFREAQSVAARDKDAREKVARQRADKLEPKLVRLAVVVEDGAEVPGLAITRDGIAIGRALWGAETPVDPGIHVIRATAPDRVTFESTIAVEPGAPHARVSIPPLAMADGDASTSDAAASARPPAEPEEGRRLSNRKIVALGLGGVAVAGVAVGTIFGIRAMGTLDDADQRCDDRFCDAEGLALRDDAKGQALVSTIAFAAGGVALAAGIALWVTSPTAPVQASVAPVALPGGGAVSAHLRF